MAERTLELKGRERKFVDAYLGECFGNATAAAKAAGCRRPERDGWRLLGEQAVRKAINAELARAGITRERVLRLLVEVLDADIGEMVEVVDGKFRMRLLPTPPGAEPQPGRLAGPTHLLRNVTVGNTSIRVEMLDKMRAGLMMGNFLGMWRGPEEEDGGTGFSEFAEAIFDSARNDAEE